MYFLLYQGIIFISWLLSCLISSVLAVDGDGSDLHGLSKYYVLHSPNFNIRARSDPFESGNTMGIEFKDQNAVYILSNENTVDSLVYSGMGLANVPYRYIVINSDGKITRQELFYRDPTNTTSADTYNNKKNRVHADSMEYVKISYSYPGAEDEVTYTPKLNRSVVHPFTHVYSLSIFADDKDLSSIHDNVLESIPISVNCTRITPEVRNRYINANLTVDGNSARLYKKLSYNLDLPDDQTINGHQRFKLRAITTDPSYMRERMYYDTLSIAGVPAAKGSYVRLYINGKPEGLYLLLDRYESPFWKILFGSPSNSYDNYSNDNDDDDDDDDNNRNGGWNHYNHKRSMHKYKKKKHSKHRHSDPNKKYYDEIVHNSGEPIHGGLIRASVQDINFNQIDIAGSTLQYRGMEHSDYLTPKGEKLYQVVQESSTGDVMDALISFMSFIESTKSIDLPDPIVEENDIETQNRLVDQWNAYFDVSTFLKNIAMELVLSNTDGYCFSGTHYYLYQDISQNGRFVYLPYNVDLIMGSTRYPARNGTNPFEDLDRFGAFQYIDRRPLLKQILAVPLFNDRFNTILLDFYTLFFTTSVAGNSLDTIYNLVQEDAGWDRALLRFRADNFEDKEDLYKELVQERIEQYPLGQDYQNRQDIIPFEKAVRGPIRDFPSLIGVYQHFNTTVMAMEAYFQSMQNSSKPNFIAQRTS